MLSARGGYRALGRALNPHYHLHPAVGEKRLNRSDNTNMFVVLCELTHHQFFELLSRVSSPLFYQYSHCHH